jgi:osmotically inducible protein OsmC
MKIIKRASATWSGPVPSGQGVMSLGQGQELPFSLKSRVEDSVMTNPEELVGAALAGCFSMALTSLIEEAGKAPGSISTSAKVTLEQKSDGFYITEIALTCRGSEQELTDFEFVELANTAKGNCPVSRLYATAEITLDAALA